MKLLFACSLHAPPCRHVFNQPQPHATPHAYNCHLATAAGGLTAILVLIFLVNAGPLHLSAPFSTRSTSNSTGVSAESAASAAAAAGLDPSRPFLDPHHQPTTGTGSSQQQQQQQGYVYVPPGEASHAPLVAGHLVVCCHGHLLHLWHNEGCGINMYQCCSTRQRWPALSMAITQQQQQLTMLHRHVLEGCFKGSLQG